MKYRIRIIFLLLAPFLAYAGNNNYVNNRVPLTPTPFIQLPLGSITAEGWLLKQLQLQKEGLTGHAETLYSSDGDLGPGCDWLGGTGDSWERAPYYTKGLVALAYVLGDEELKTKAQKWIDWSLDHQRTDGYFGPTNNKDWWARMPMLYAIRDYYDATNDARVIPFFTKYFEYQNNNIEQQPLSSWGKSRTGDNIEIVFWLYNRTGDAFLLDLADKLKNQAYDWTNIFANNLFNQFAGDFQPKHNVNIPQAMKMPAIYYQKSQKKADRDAYFRGLAHLQRDHGQPVGMQSGSEMVCGKSSMTGLELCSVVEQMQTSETVQMILGDASIGDQLEKVAFNALPGGLTADIKGLQYYQQANQVISQLGYTGFAQNYDNGYVPSPYSGYGCCRFDFHHGYPYFVKTLWAATHDNGLAVMAYAPSRVTARVANKVEVSIHEVTDYPFSEKITFTLSTARPVAFPLKFRIPAWCNAPEIKVNGSVQTGMKSGSFYTIKRKWSNNDRVEISFPMPLTVNEEVNNSVSIQRGPLVFSLKIDEDWSIKHDYGNGFTESEVSPASAWSYALMIDRNNPSASIQIVESEMPDNPFVQETTPVKLLVPARKLSSWQYAHSGRMATDPPYSPVETQSRVEQVTLVPYGSETLRVTCLPWVGAPNRITTEFTEDFTNGQSGWVQYGGSWTVKDGEYFAGELAAGHNGSKSIYSATLFSDFVYEADVQINSDQGDAGLLFRCSRLAFAPDEYDGYYVGINSVTNRVVLGKADGGWHLLASAPVEINTNQWHHLKIVARGSNIQIYVDDRTTPKIRFFEPSFLTGSIGVRAWDALARWDNISVVSLNNTDVSEKYKGQQTTEKYIVEMDYLQYLPDGYEQDETELWPLVIFLHGAGETGTNIEQVRGFGLSPLIEAGRKFPFIVVSPQTKTHGWNSGEIRNLLVNDLFAKLRIDPDRVYLTGLSMGGYGTWNTAMNYPELFAAILPICGGGYEGGASRLRNMPIWCFHGDMDDIVPIKNSEVMVNALKDINHQVKFTVYEGVGHESWTRTYANDSIYDWLLQHKRYKNQRIELDNTILSSYQGVYRNDKREHEFRLEVEDKGLRIWYGEHQGRLLLPKSVNEFYYDDYSPNGIRFEKDNKGNVNGLTELDFGGDFYKKR